MRYLMTLGAALALVAAPVAAQAQVGVLGGVSFGNVSNSGLLPGNVGPRTGFTLGIEAFTPGFLSFGVEGLYSQRGVSSSAGFDSRKLQYLDFPLLLRVKLPAPGLQPYAYVGPQLSYELSCDSGPGDCPGDRPHAPWAGVVGAGVQFGARNGIKVEGRYIYGLQNLDLNTITTAESYRERSFMILAGITF
jgi:Outer membrane protein beta-barrel domain